MPTTTPDWPIATFTDLRFIRWKLLLYTAGGIIINLLLAAALLLLADYSLAFSEGIQLVALMGGANLLTALLASIPYRSSYQGVGMDSDGLSMFRLPFYKRSQLLELSNINLLFDAWDEFEAKNYKAAIQRYEDYQSKTGDADTANFNLAMAHLKMGNYGTARELIEKLLPFVEKEPKKYNEAFIYNGLAWVFLLTEELDLADQYSELAYSKNPHHEAIRGTRASVLIELGNYEEGRRLMIHDVDFDFANHQTVSAAIYLAWANTMLDDPSMAKRYVEFAETNRAELDVDEQLLFDRVKERMARHHAQP